MANFLDQYDLRAAKGVFSMRAVRRDGSVLFHIEEPNLIVTGAKGIMAARLGEDTAGKRVTRIGFGTSNTAAAMGDTALTGAYVRNVASVTYPAGNQVSFNWTLDFSEAVGMTIYEYGLLSVDGTLFSRKVRGAVTKDQDLSLEGTWTIAF